MSVQEERFARIAAAIRQKDGTTAPINALDFEARILAIPTGGGGSSDFAVPLAVTVDTTAEVTAVNGDITVTGVTDADNIARLILTAPGVWTVAAKSAGKEKSTKISIIDGYASKISLLSGLPDGYVKLEYISSADKLISCVATDLYYPDVSKIEMDIQPNAYEQGTNGAQHFFTGGKNFGVWRYPGTTVRYCVGTPNASSFSYTIPSKRFVLFFDSVEKRINFGTEKQQAISVYSSQSLAPISVFGNSSSYSYSIPCKLWSCKFYNVDGGILSDLVPCKDPSGKVGLYDTEREKFFEGVNVYPGPEV